jgi:hypothetical protein
MGGRAGRLNAVAFVLVVIETADLLMEESAAVDTAAETGFSVTASLGARIVPCVAAGAAFSFEAVAESPARTARVADADAAESTAADEEALALDAGFSMLSRSSSSRAWADATSVVLVPVASSS